MQTLQAPSTSLSAASLSTHPSSGPTSQKHRYSSRSNSLSSASVVTVKRSTSRSSSNTGVRNSIGPARVPSPDDLSAAAQRLSRDPMSQDYSRRQSTTLEASERANGENMTSLHRWSHSTDSNMTSISSARSRTSSGAPLPNFQPHKKSRSIVDHSPRPSPQRQRSSPRPTSRRRPTPPASPERARRASRQEVANSLSELPPLHTILTLADPNDVGLTSPGPTLATPSTSSAPHDYFGEDGVSPRSNVRSKKPSTTRNHTTSTFIGDAARMQAVEGAQEMQSNGQERKHQQNTSLESNGTDRSIEGDNSGAATTAEPSRHKRTRTTDKERSEREKKAMLSKALQKANTAVLLDNAQNFEGALEAYTDACKLLQQVMDRSSGADDKRKLDSIRGTYTNRIQELRQLEAAQPMLVSTEKSLPTRPMSAESMPLSPASAFSPTIDTHVIPSPTMETASTAQAARAPTRSISQKDRDSFFGRTGGTPSPKDRDTHPIQERPPAPRVEEPPSQEMTEVESPVLARTLAHPAPEQQQFGGLKKAVGVPPLNVDGLHIPPSNNKFIPAPLSPRRPSPSEEQSFDEEPSLLAASKEQSAAKSIAINDTGLSASWLDPIDETDSSCGSSVHSVSSQQGLRRKHIRGVSGDTNPDFDAAFDAAVEAAYDEGFEPDVESSRQVEPTSASRHAPKESLVVPSSEIKEILSPTNSYHPGMISARLNLDLDDEEEERLLDEFTQDYSQSFNFDSATKSALPRQSDSSAYSRSTWQSSVVSDRTTAGTSLSTVAEDATIAAGSKNAFAASNSLNTILTDAPSVPPPLVSLPKPPAVTQNRISGVRMRRLSGKELKQLKIETTAKAEARPRGSTFHHAGSPVKEEDIEEEGEDLNRDFRFGADLQPTNSAASEQRHQHLLKSPPSLDMLSGTPDTSRPATATAATTEYRRSVDESPQEGQQMRPGLVQKTESSTSLREHTFIVPSPLEPNSSTTPMSSTFLTFASSKRLHEGPLNTQRANLPVLGPSSSNALPSGVYLFDTSLASSAPLSPRTSTTNPPALEPCPQSTLLRPFWLLRALHGTLVHPKGAFLTTRLFVPREAWQTKGVKLKAIDEKIANCDLLTAALGRLAGVDTYDADALMEELQGFEEVMERVQAALSKKLGSDVGVGGLAGIFRDAGNSAPYAAPGGTTPTVPEVPSFPGEKSKSKESSAGKSYLSSWRKLRSKSSGAPISGNTSSGNAAANRAAFLLQKGAEREGQGLLASVPMTSYVPVERRGQGASGKGARGMVFEGSLGGYMASLARLFEGVGVLDQIARQVEDPGLKGSSPTLVGLELSVRHAAEFFAFFICRFVLADLGVLVEKFVKRGTEWVMV